MGWATEYIARLQAGLCGRRLGLNFLEDAALVHIQDEAEVIGQRKAVGQVVGPFPVFLQPRVGVRAMTFPAEHRIEVYARPQDDIHLLAYDIAHELGHAMDMTYNTNETRRNWMELRGIDPATPWFGCDKCSDYSTPAGDFAETFALLLFGPKEFRGRIAPPPSAQQIPLLFRFFPMFSSPALTN